MDAIEDAEVGSTVVIFDDVEIEEEISITKKITLNLNGKTITNVQEIWNDVEDPNLDRAGLICVRAGGDLTITGEGTIDALENDIITIDSAEKLAGVAAAVNDGESFLGYTIRLACDMDMAGKTWTPIGVGLRSASANAKPFSGIFDGNDKKIIGLNSGDYATSVLADEHKSLEGDLETEVYTYHYGFFGYVSGATITDLELTVNFNCNAENLKGDSVGGLVGFSTGKLTINDCEVNGTIDGGFDSVGGLVGRAYNSTADNAVVITDSENNAEVTALYKAAGILGYAGSSDVCVTIDDCENNGKITATGVNLTVSSNKRHIDIVSGIVIYGWKVSKTNKVVVTDCENNGNIYATATRSEEADRTNLHYYAYIATRVGDDFNEEYHSYKFQNNENNGKLYYLGEEATDAVMALVDNNLPQYSAEDEYNNKTNITE
ncbi:MAG: hypothetical protein J6Q13_04210 [Clostridia bacterium]|nr:hypothetical protein [Clostridia bacterium]